MERDRQRKAGAFSLALLIFLTLVFFHFPINPCPLHCSDEKGAYHSPVALREMICLCPFQAFISPPAVVFPLLEGGRKVWILLSFDGDRGLFESEIFHPPEDLTPA